jgi:hypothetical protein
MARKSSKTSTATVDELIAQDTAAPRALSSELLHRITSTAALLRDAKANLAKAEVVMEEWKGVVRRLREQTLPALLDEAQVSSLGLQDADGTIVEKSEEVYASLSKDKAPAACAWLDEHGYGALIKSEVVVEAPRGDRQTAIAAMNALRKAKVSFVERSTVHPQTLKAFVRESLAEGRVLSPDITYHTVPVVDLKAKRAKKKKSTTQALPFDPHMPEF